MPYLFNVRKLEDSEIVGIVQVWLDKCAAARQLDFNSKYVVKQYIRSRKKNHKLSSDSPDLYNTISQIG